MTYTVNKMNKNEQKEEEMLAGLSLCKDYFHSCFHKAYFGQSGVSSLPKAISCYSCSEKLL